MIMKTMTLDNKGISINTNYDNYTIMTMANDGGR